MEVGRGYGIAVFFFAVTAALGAPAAPQLQRSNGSGTLIDPPAALTAVDCRETNDRLTIVATGADGLQLTVGIAVVALQASWHTPSTYRFRGGNTDFSAEYHDGVSRWGLSRNRNPFPQCDLTLTRTDARTFTVGLDCRNLKDEAIELPGLRFFTLTGDALTCTLSRALR